MSKCDMIHDDHECRMLPVSTRNVFLNVAMGLKPAFAINEISYHPLQF